MNNARNWLVWLYCTIWRTCNVLIFENIVLKSYVDLSGTNTERYWTYRKDYSLTCYRSDNCLFPFQKCKEPVGFFIVASLELRLKAITKCIIGPRIFRIHYTWTLHYHRITTPTDDRTNWIFFVIGLFYKTLSRNESSGLHTTRQWYILR